MKKVPSFLPVACSTAEEFLSLHRNREQKASQIGRLAQLVQSVCLTAEGRGFESLSAHHQEATQKVASFLYLPLPLPFLAQKSLLHKGRGRAEGRIGEQAVWNAEISRWRGDNRCASFGEERRGGRHFCTTHKKGCPSCEEQLGMR